MSLSLTAVFLPITLMGGIVGKFFYEFAIVLSASVLISLVVSLTTTPMMCANLDLHKPDRRQGWLLRGAERTFDAMLRFYDRTLSFALRWPLLIMGVLGLTIVLNVVLYVIIPKGFFPVEDTGDVNGGIRADQSISFQLMEKKFASFVSIIAKDPAVQSVVGLRRRRRGRAARRRHQFRQRLRPAQAEIRARRAEHRPGHRPAAARSAGQHLRRAAVAAERRRRSGRGRTPEHGRLSILRCRATRWPS